MLEDCFNVRINMYIYDEDQHKTGRPIPWYPVYISKKDYKRQTLHLLMLAQKKKSYYHVVFITRPVDGIQGYNCSHCNTTYTTYEYFRRHLNRGHNTRQAGTTSLKFQYGSFKRPLTIWEQLRMCGVQVPEKPLQPNHYVIFKFIVNTGLSHTHDGHLGQPLYIWAKSTIHGDKNEFIGSGPDMVENFLKWLTYVQAMDGPL